jgi:hypothetical protein
MYKVDEKARRRRRRRIVFIILLLLALLSYFGYKTVKDYLKVDTKITQSHAVEKTLKYDSKVKHYEEADFGIDLPATWVQVPREAGPFQTFTWQTSDHGTNGQKIQIFEDTIPQNFAVNRALIVTGEGATMSLNGEASDNCKAYTRNPTTQGGTVGGTAKWQGVDFICDTGNGERNVVGTSSSDGTNIVILRNASTGQNHKFLFTYTNSSLTPEYTSFYSALRSFKMQ